MNFYTPRQTILCRPKVGGAHLRSRKWISWSPSGCSTPDPFRPTASLRPDPPHVYGSGRAGAGLFTVTVWSPVTTPESTVTPPLPTRVAVPLLDPRRSLIGGIGGIRISGPWWASRADHRLPLCWWFPDDMREDILQSACRESQPSDNTRSVVIQQIILLGEQEPLDAARAAGKTGGPRSPRCP